MLKLISCLLLQVANTVPSAVHTASHYTPNLPGKDELHCVSSGCHNKICTRGSLNNRNLFLTVLEKNVIKVPTS